MTSRPELSAARGARRLEGRGRALGTCGEIVQGQLAPGEDFLITLPVPLAATASVYLAPGEPRLEVRPAHKTKAAEAVRRTLAFLSAPLLGGELRVESDLPEGKGMASSSADIVAAVRATGAALGRELAEEEISAIAAAIEPTDGVMYAPLVVAYDHRRGRLRERLGYMPPAAIAVVDLGGRLDTVAFNARPKAYSEAERARLRRAYALAREGLRAGDLRRIGEAGIISARVNQRLLPKPALEPLTAAALGLGAAGIVIAHSGSVAGVLFAGGGAAAELPAALARAGIRYEALYLTTTLPAAP